MSTDPTATAGVTPLLFRHATPRTSWAELPGHYDPATQLWVVETRAGLRPVVDMASSADLDTSTSTRVRQESDDEDAAADAALAALLDTSTVTKGMTTIWRATRC